MDPTAAVVGLTASAGVGHVLYPMLLRIVSRGRSWVAPAPPESWPPVTVLIPAYLEKGVIAGKVRDVAENGYPGELEILVVADGDPETAEVARGAGARVVLLEERGGKSQALNRGVAAASHEIIVVTDANNRIDEGSIARLANWFQEERVGAVAGEKVEGEEAGELLYWRFEGWIKSREAALGTTLGLDGGLCGVRRSAWRDIPVDISNDDFWIALDLVERDYVVAYEPTAIVREEPIGAVSLQWERRTRVLGGGLWVMWRKRSLLSWRRPLITFEILGHKLWRSTLGPISHLALLVVAIAKAPRSRIAALFVAGHAFAFLGWGLVATGRRAPRLLRIGAQVLFLQAVAFGGMRRFLRGDRVLRWAKPAR